MTNWIDRCHFGDCRDTMRAMIADGVKVQTIVTSPPYWGLRDYGVDGQIGHETTLREFIGALVDVFELCRELLADDGTAWVNMGDAYAGSWGAQGRPQGKGEMTGRSVASARQIGAHPRFETCTGNRGKEEGLKNKDLMGQPWRLAFALQDAGWYLRQDIIWHKPNTMPESVQDRCTKAHEYLFLLSKSERYQYDAAAIKDPASFGPTPTGVGFGHGFDSPDRIEKRGRRVPGNKSHKGTTAYESGAAEHRTKAGLVAFAERERAADPDEPAFRNKRSVWTVATQPYSAAHFATFPEALVEPCVLAGSKSGEIVFDPFFGSGTTGQVAARLGRKFIGCELNPAYEALQRDRIRERGFEFA